MELLQISLVLSIKRETCMVTKAEFEIYRSEEIEVDHGIFLFDRLFAEARCILDPREMDNVLSPCLLEGEGIEKIRFHLLSFHRPLSRDRVVSTMREAGMLEGSVVHTLSFLKQCNIFHLSRPIVTLGSTKHVQVFDIIELHPLFVYYVKRTDGDEFRASIHRYDHSDARSLHFAAWELL